MDQYCFFPLILAGDWSFLCWVQPLVSPKTNVHVPILPISSPEPARFPTAVTKWLTLDETKNQEQKIEVQVWLCHYVFWIICPARATTVTDCGSHSTFAQRFCFLVQAKKGTRLQFSLLLPIHFFNVTTEKLTVHPAKSSCWFSFT